MKKFPIFSYLLVFLFISPAFGEIKINSVAVQYFQKKDFKRILEFFRGEEYTGRNLIFRSDETDREGLYFTLKFSSKLSDFPDETTIMLEVISSESIESRQYEFKFPSRIEGKKYLLVGLTGKDWSRKENKLIAWRLKIRSPTNDLLAAKQSFLWDHDE